MSQETDRNARKALSQIFDAGDRPFTQALTDHSPAEVLDQCQTGALGPDAQQRAHTLTPNLGIESSGIRFIIPSDDEWPTRLNDLANMQVSPTAGLGGVPVGLWVQGPGHLRTWCEQSVSIVGARACTAYGPQVASDLAVGISEAGWTVVSSSSFGVDIAAIQAATRSITVTPCGLNIRHPRAHDRILQQLAGNQLVVSECPPGRPPTRSRFLARNRIIAALSLGTVLVEAGVRSASRNTLAWATQLGRAAMAVPGPVESALSVAPNQLIRNQTALLVAESTDVLETVLVSPTEAAT